MILRKTPAGKDFRIYGSLEEGKKVLSVMQRYFKKHELRTHFELRQDKLHTINPEEKMAEIWPSYRPHNGKTVLCSMILNEKDDLTIIHELEHAVRYIKYGHNDPRCHDEESVERQSVKRLMKKR
jgi:hypothetical protein